MVLLRLVVLDLRTKSSGGNWLGLLPRLCHWELPLGAIAASANVCFGSKADMCSGHRQQGSRRSHRLQGNGLPNANSVRPATPERQCSGGSTIPHGIGRHWRQGVPARKIIVGDCPPQLYCAVKRWGLSSTFQATETPEDSPPQVCCKRTGPGPLSPDGSGRPCVYSALPR